MTRKYILGKMRLKAEAEANWKDEHWGVRFHADALCDPEQVHGSERVCGNPCNQNGGEKG